MTETVFTPEMTDEDYKREIDVMMAQIQILNQQSQREQAQIEKLRLESQRVMSDIQARMSRLENRSH